MCREILHEISYQLKHHVNISEVKEPIDFHIGYQEIYPNDMQSVESIIYNSIKRVIKKAKEITQLSKNEYSGQFKTILNEKNITTLFQPIVSLSLGTIFGYEALTRGPKNSYFYSPNVLFPFGESEGLLYQLEKVAREKAFSYATDIVEYNQKLFINLNSQVIYDPNFTTGYTIDILRNTKLSPQNIVFEITERNAIDDFSAFKQVIEHYREQGFQIAIDDAGAGYSSLQAISELKPDYIKVDRSLIEGIDQNNVKENLLETFVNIARKMNSKVIAEGIETLEELEKITRLGVHYGQGYILSKPTFPPTGVSNKAKACIEKHKRLKNFELTSRMSISEITSKAKVFDINCEVREVTNYFSLNNGELGVVITKNNQPVGLVMKEKLNQELAKPFGISLFFKKPIQSLIDNEPLVVDSNAKIDEVAQLAITREHKKMYDYVIVKQNEGLLGVVSVEHIIDFLANIKMEIVRHANPLTGLPGNSLIKKEIINRIKNNFPFSLIYVDIDYFKAFNDLYGFQRGDQVIRYLAELIQEIVFKFGNLTDFIGHIGGDDFVIITFPNNSLTLSEEMIKAFDATVGQFYETTCDTIQDRNGKTISPSNIGISLAVIECVDSEHLDINKLSVISASVKKQSKMKNGSNFTLYKCSAIDGNCY